MKHQNKKYSLKNKIETQPDNIDIVLQKNNKKQAEVTVVIPLYNYEGYIVSAMNSVKAQTQEFIDLVIVDDCSTDNSLEITKNWLYKNDDRFNRYKLIHHKINQGLAKTRNTAINYTETDFIFPLDADNMLYPRCIESLLSGLKISKASFAYCYLEHFGDINAIGGLQPWDASKLKNGNTIDAMVLHRKSVLIKIDGYSEDMPGHGWEDYELWFKIAKLNGWGIRIPEILARYRVHIDSMLFIETDENILSLMDYIKKNHKEYF